MKPITRCLSVALVGVAVAEFVEAVGFGSEAGNLWCIQHCICKPLTFGLAQSTSCQFISTFAISNLIKCHEAVEAQERDRFAQSLSTQSESLLGVTLVERLEKKVNLRLPSFGVVLLLSGSSVSKSSGVFMSSCSSSSSFSASASFFPSVSLPEIYKVSTVRVGLL